MSDAKTEEMSFADFARHLGCKPGYVTQLRKDGRLVLTEDGKRVKVEASKALISDSRDPSKRGVAQRHAQQRGAAVDTGHDTDPVDNDTGTRSTEDGYQKARAVKERYGALTAKVEYERLIGRLADIGTIEAAATDVITTLRTRLESLGAVLGPQVAPLSNEAQCAALISEYVEHALEEASRQLDNLAKGHAE